MNDSFSPHASAELRSRLLGLEEHLTTCIRGQEPALRRMASVLRRGELGLSAPGRPKGSFLLLGPTGVGKTESTVVFTDYLLGKERLFRFDMSEYQTQGSLGLLLGEHAHERGILGEVLANASCGTLLFDEIEKAHPRIMDVFLQILDAARVSFADGTTADLSGFYMVFTSNIASGELLDWQHSTFTTMERHVLAQAQQWLRPELYARITEKLVFQRLDYEVQVEIARMMLERQLALLKSKGFTLPYHRASRRTSVEGRGKRNNASPYQQYPLLCCNDVDLGRHRTDHAHDTKDRGYLLGRPQRRVDFAFC